MAYEPWNELDPAGTDAAGTLWDDIRQFKRQVRERLIGVFSDWSTATDRLTAVKICVDGTTGLKFRNSTDASDYASIDQNGFPLFNKPVFIHMHRLGLAANNITYAGATIFPGAPTETLDPASLSAGNWRVTIPAGFGGNYRVTATCTFQLGVIGSRAIRVYKNGGVIGPMNYLYVPAATNFDYASCYLSTVLALNATDYIEPFIISAPAATFDVGDMQFSVERVN